MFYVDESALERLLKKAARAHEQHKANHEEPGVDWPAWYAAFIIKRLQEWDEKE